jgi:hypothetical protein
MKGVEQQASGKQQKTQPSHYNFSLADSEVIDDLKLIQKAVNNANYPITPKSGRKPIFQGPLY